MPAAFHMEALKRRQFNCQKLCHLRIEAYREEGKSGIECGIMRSGSLSGLAFSEKLKELNPSVDEDYWPRIEQAVEETVGLVMT